MTRLYKATDRTVDLKSNPAKHPTEKRWYCHPDIDWSNGNVITRLIEVDVVVTEKQMRIVGRGAPGLLKKTWGKLTSGPRAGQFEANDLRPSKKEAIEHFIQLQKEDIAVQQHKIDDARQRITQSEKMLSTEIETDGERVSALDEALERLREDPRDGFVILDDDGKEIHFVACTKEKASRQQSFDGLDRKTDLNLYIYDLRTLRGKK